MSAISMDDTWVKVEQVDTPMGSVAFDEVPAFADIEQQLKYIKTEREELKPLLLQARRTRGFENPTEQQTALLERMTKLFNWLDADFHMTPELREQTSIETFLRQVYNPVNCFSQQYAQKAKALQDKWVAQNLGKPPKTERIEPFRVKDEDNDRDGGQSPTKRARIGQRGSASTADAAKMLYLPPKDDLIWGSDGIMHGIAIRRGPDGRRTNTSDPRYVHEKRGAKYFGHNGLENGDWFPYRLNAIFHGAHGASRAGISGDSVTGAYSIVVSSQYEDFDQDLKNTIIYSGAGSNDNMDPDRGSQNPGNLALHASIQRQSSVRVLRAASGSAYAPTVGIRYDGLYRVVSADNTMRNKLGGMVERFKLQREAGQPPIDESRPTRGEVKKFDMVGQTSLRRWTARRDS